MYNIDVVAKMYFNCVPLSKILNSDIKYDDFPTEEFHQLSTSYLQRYSDTENRNLQKLIEDSVGEEGHPYASLSGRGGKNVFAILEEIAEQLLTLEDNRVRCQYRSLIRLRELTEEIEEDLLICAYLAVRSRRFGGEWQDFSWPMAIRHNNVQLNRIVQKGISENHFHLFGSSPAYQLVWIQCMNDVVCADYRELFEEIDKKPRKPRVHYNTDYIEEKCWRRIVKAALIRVHITEYLLERIEVREQDEIFFENSKVERLLTNEENIEDYIIEIQSMIDYLANLGEVVGYGEQGDYILSNVKGRLHVDSELNNFFAGERWFIYHMLTNELTGIVYIPQYMYQWFYAYLAIKSSFRGEMIQVNKNVGFENFSIYNKRKRGFRNKMILIRSAVNDILMSGYFQSLELRVMPGDSAKRNYKNILDIENVIREFTCTGKSDTQVYYVFHFSKCADEKMPDRKSYDGMTWRHFNKHKKLNRQANAIKDFREQYSEIAAKVCGIDACSQEIGCRPEVFASVFRFLSNHILEPWKVGYPMEQLKMTYHVGEDFLDVVDGLRAVDEAIRFLELRCGDRIGHGTVLGIDVQQWYRSKDNTIFVAKQDYLDNVVWLHQRLSEFRIEGMDNLREYLKAQFDIYYSAIYGEEDRDVEGHVTIRDYYEAWKLRGDDPKLYMSGEFDEHTVHIENKEFLISSNKDMFSLRKRKELCRLYHRYHYDWNVRKNGGEVIELYVPEIYVKGAIEIQKKMQQFVARRGIGIETNPSSNVSISTMRAYDEHPIIRMYNKDLFWDVEKLSECAQMYVSINTDDRGVFHTSLENEYALMACAMERARDGKGEHLYNRQMIYQWLDNIREMGNMQSFRRENL